MYDPKTFWFNEEAYDARFASKPQSEFDPPTQLRPSMEVVSKLDENEEGLVGAEIGIGSAHNTVCILNGLNIKKLYCVDWEFHRDHPAIHPDVKKHDDKIKFINKSSHQGSEDIPDNSLDFCYIDAGHDLPNIVSDIYDYYPKVKEGGVLCGHDFNLRDVNRVVNAFWLNIWRLQNKKPQHGYDACPSDHPGFPDEYKKCGFPLDWWYVKEGHIDDLQLVELRNS